MKPVLFLILLSLPVLVFAQAPVGGPIQVAVSSSGFLRGPDVAMNARGDFAVGWARMQPSGFPAGVFGRLYAANGRPRTGEFRLDPGRADRAFAVRLAMMDDGSFVSVFSSSSGLRAQRFTAAGGRIGGLIALTPIESGNFEVAARGDDGFVVAWQELAPGLFARAFGPDGRALGPPVRVVIATVGALRLAVAPEGSFLVIWVQVETTGPASHNLFLQGRFFNADGTPRGEGFLISDKLSEDLYSFAGYDTAMDSEGNFLVTWFVQETDPIPPTAYVRRYAPDGSPLSGPAPAGHRPAGQEIAAGPAGRFVSVWQTNRGPSVSIVARELTGDGAPGGPLVVLGQAPGQTFPGPVLAGDGAGSFVTAWIGKPRRGDGSAVFARRFRTE